MWRCAARTMALNKMSQSHNSLPSSSNPAPPHTPSHISLERLEPPLPPLLPTCCSPSGGLAPSAFSTYCVGHWQQPSWQLLALQCTCLNREDSHSVWAHGHTNSRSSWRYIGRYEALHPPTRPPTHAHDHGLTYPASPRPAWASGQSARARAPFPPFLSTTRGAQGGAEPAWAPPPMTTMRCCCCHGNPGEVPGARGVAGGRPAVLLRMPTLPVALLQPAGGMRGDTVCLLEWIASLG
jgi:hypothetical protein